VLAGDDFYKLPSVALKTAHALFKAAIAAAAADGLEAAVAAARDATTRIAATAAIAAADGLDAAVDAAVVAARDAAAAVAARENAVDALLEAWHQKKTVRLELAVQLLVLPNTVLSAVFVQLLEKKKLKSADSVIEFLLADALRQCQLVWDPFKPSRAFEHRQGLEVLFQSQSKLLAIPEVWTRVFGCRPPLATVSEEQIAYGKASSATWGLFSDVMSHSTAAALLSLIFDINRPC
jgi:hypothetical protein